jgi:hypothetical protein
VPTAIWKLYPRKVIAGTTTITPLEPVIPVRTPVIIPIKENTPKLSIIIFRSSNFSFIYCGILHGMLKRILLFLMEIIKSIISEIKITKNISPEVSPNILNQDLQT